MDPKSVTMFVVSTIAIGAVVKLLVDVLKISPIPVASGWLPLIALGLGWVIELVALVASGGSFSLQIVAQCFLAGVLCGGGAIGLTEAQNKGNEKPIGS